MISRATTIHYIVQFSSAIMWEGSNGYVSHLWKANKKKAVLLLQIHLTTPSWGLKATEKDKQISDKERGKCESHAMLNSSMQASEKR